MGYQATPESAWPARSDGSGDIGNSFDRLLGTEAAVVHSTELLWKCNDRHTESVQRHLVLVYAGLRVLVGAPNSVALVNLIIPALWEIQ
jgi:hypothetical protein